MPAAGDQVSGSGLLRAGATTELVTKRLEQFTKGGEVGPKLRLPFHPALGVRPGDEHAATGARRPFHDPTVDEEEQDGGGLPEGDFRPVCRAPEVVLQVQPDVANRFLDERDGMLIVAVPPVVGQAAVPTLTQTTHK